VRWDEQAFIGAVASAVQVTEGGGGGGGPTSGVGESNETAGARL